MNEVVARRLTADLRSVLIFSDGGISNGFGGVLATGVLLRPRNSEASRVAWMFADEVALFDLDETPALYAACRSVVASGGTPGDARSAASAALAPTVSPEWLVEDTDRDGRVVTRWWRCPRVVWPGLAVLNRCNRAPRYEVFRTSHDDVARPTGFTATSLRDLRAVLDTMCPRGAR